MWTAWFPHLIGAIDMSIIAATLAITGRYRARPPRPSRAIIEGAAGGLLVAFILFAYFLPTMPAREMSWSTWEVAFWNEHPLPWQPILLVSLCSAVLCGSNPDAQRVKWGVVSVFLVLGWFLGYAYRVEIRQQIRNVYAGIHPPVTYTLTPHTAVMVTRGRVHTLRHRLHDQDPFRANTRVYPAGWLRETPCWTALPAEYQRAFINIAPYFHKGIVTTRAEWHTPLTGFYRVVEVPTAIWYPGGAVKDAIGKLEFRPRPE
ncbi:MAG TPA: hypothetical protein PLZ36_16030 [Armatimonadota bacterium]|nr:hypothetical protein [Armatimonadota bacterium]HOS43432.1 hypothetical protein [Armatimonadota bacterium]